MSVVSCELAVGNYPSMPIPGLDTEFDLPYTIIVDDVNDTAADIYGTGVLPARFTAFAGNVFATVRRISLSREENDPLTWRANVHYSSAPLTQSELDAIIENPADRPAQIDWEDVPYYVPQMFGESYSRDALPALVLVTTPIVNSAGDMPDQVPEGVEYLWRANVMKNVNAVPYWIDDGYSGAVNSVPFFIEGRVVPAEHCRMTSLKLGRWLREGSYNYRQLTFSLEFKQRREQRTDANGVLDANDIPPPPFNLELPDIGLHKKEGISGLRKRIYTDDTPPKPVSQPVPLDGQGETLANPTPFDIVLLNWRVCRRRDFNVLPLT